MSMQENWMLTRTGHALMRGCKRADNICDIFFHYRSINYPLAAKILVESMIVHRSSSWGCTAAAAAAATG